MADISREYIKNYSLLKQIGIVDEMDSLRKNIQELEGLLISSLEIFSKKSIGELLDFLMSCLIDKVIPSEVYIILLEGIEDEQKVIYYKNLKQENCDIKHLAIECYVSFFLENAITWRYPELLIKTNTPPEKCPFAKVNPDLVMPIVGISGLYGVILFGKKVLDSEYTENEISYIARISKFVSISLQNNIHYYKSVIDGKTKLYNHDYFSSRIHEEVLKCKRYNTFFSLLILDIDFFKKVNDQYGHMAGDIVLIELAKIIKEGLRDSDVASRFGGEEFTILLPSCKVENAFEIAERIRNKISEHRFIFNNTKLQVTVSLGITAISPGTAISDKEVFEQADTALYRSKENGRNRSTVFKE